MLPLIGMLLALALRIFWIEDMEYKGDEARYSTMIYDLFNHPYNPLTPVISEHSGIAHPSGFLYFSHLISFGSESPLAMAFAIAFVNGLAIAIGIWLGRKSEKALLTFLMCATSFTLVLGSRKIWTPDLVCVWICLFMGLFLYSQENPTRGAQSSKDSKDSKRKKLPKGLQNVRLRKDLALGASGFFVALAGHMYLPGFFFGAIASAVLAIWFFWKKMGRSFWIWVSGSTLGWLTWGPYLYLLLWRRAPGTTYQNYHVTDAVSGGPNPKDLIESFAYASTLPSPLAASKIYLYDYLIYLQRSAPPLLLNILLFVLASLGILWTGLFFHSLYQVYNRWKKALQDPMLVVSVSVIFGTIFALQVIHLGNYLHYWLGAIPFAYYMIAWSYTQQSTLGNTKTFRLKHLITTGLVGSTVSVLLFFALVRTMGGLPGEYWRSYRNQFLESNSR